MILATAAIKAQVIDAESVKRAVNEWLAEYPESQYADVYKNFFQDSYGPGHLLTDRAAARRYLESELSSSELMDGPLLEPTGSEGRFIRVNLSVIRDGIIPEEVYFEAFVKSMEGIEVPSDETWRNNWESIDGIIREMGLHFPEEEADRATVDAALRSGDFAVHHSRRYDAAYSRHYRIIRRDIVEEELLPRIKTP